MAGLSVGAPSPAWLLRGHRKGLPTELWLGGTQFLPKDAMVAEATGRYRKTRTARGTGTG